VAARVEGSTVEFRATGDTVAQARRRALQAAIVDACEMDDGPVQRRAALKAAKEQQLLEMALRQEKELAGRLKQAADAVELSALAAATMAAEAK
jgi:hypothetical protein